MAGDKKVTASRPAGWYTINDPVFGLQEWDTLQCVHCGAHWRIMPGSGRQRGWCMKCGGPTCGAQRCSACYPWEQQLDDAEARKIIIP